MQPQTIIVAIGAYYVLHVTESALTPEDLHIAGALYLICVKPVAASA